MADLFTTRSLLGSIQGSDFGAKSFLRDRYFGNIRTFDTKKIDVDIVDSMGRKLAPFVSPKIGGKVIAAQGYRTNTYETPELAPERFTLAEEFLNRSAGEAFGGTRTPAQRAGDMAQVDLLDLDTLITRREEAMCAEALFTGKVTISGDGVNDQIDYWNGITAPTSTSSTLWTAEGATGATIMQELIALRRSIAKAGGRAPKDMLLGSRAADPFIAKMKDYLDTRKVDMGNINPQILPDGVTYWGFLKAVGVDVYSYDEWYINDSNTEVPMVPATKVLFASANAATTMAYGLCGVADKVNNSLAWYEGKRIPSSYVNETPAGRMLKLQSRPLPIINRPTDFYVLTPVGA